MDTSEAQLLQDLNPPQREAVLHGDGALLVLAGAGSGKTRVITRRIAHLVRHRGVAPWRILAVTFTNKAAREMRERLLGLLGAEGEPLVVSTFHSAAAMILRREAEAVGLTRSFVIYDDGDQLQVVKRALKEVQIDSVLTPRDLMWRINSEKNQGRTAESLKADPNDYREQSIVRAYQAYSRLMKAANAVDFGDLLLLLVELLRTHPDIRRKYQVRFQHVLVDEFQDTNPVQAQLLELLAPSPSNLTVVGDDDQSIYRWRGAEVENILKFPDLYPDARVVKLEQNYRSDNNILSAAHAVIAHNPRRMGKKLWSDRPAGENLSLLVARDERGEAQEIVQRIRQLVSQGVAGYDQMAIFYRVNAQSRILEEALRLARLPYTLVSGRSFYERAEVKDAASYLRLMANPRSDADLLRVINVPARGIGDTTVERLTNHAARLGGSLYETLADVSAIPGLNGGAQKRLLSFRALMEGLVAYAAQATSAADALGQMYEETGLVRTLQTEGSDEAMSRAENLREFLGAAQEFDLDQSRKGPPLENALAEPGPPLQEFLERISLVGDADEEVGEGRVALMTLHAAKGLEYDVVFLPGMEEGVFPHSRALDENADPEELAEERRLCYVGFTRARRRLIVSLAQSRALFGELRFNPPSRFLSEVPQELFGLTSMPRPIAAQPFEVRRRSQPTPDEYPQIDRSYDQSGDYGGGDSLVGRKVRHPQFGDGKIVALDGVGPNAKLTVNFGGAVGLKRVIARFLELG